VNKYHYNLNLPVKFVPTELDTSINQFPQYPLYLLDEEFKNWFHQFGIEIGNGQLFVLDPNRKSSYEIHVDESLDIPLVKLNYVFCDAPSVMNWYEVKTGRQIKKLVLPDGSEYGDLALECAPEDCELVYSAHIGQPSLINASVLHTVATVTSKRYCYAFVLIKKGTDVHDSNSRVTWEEAVNIFKDYMVNE
jgi:hypothetical protein